MNNSLKVGIISGLIAGLVGGIAAFVHALLEIEIGDSYWFFQTLTITAIKNIAFVNITINIIWWIIAGLIYVKIYDLIPGKRILKGLVYSLGLGLIFSVRVGTYELFYGNVTISFLWIITWYLYIISGLVFGASYEFLSNKYSVPKYKKKTYKNDLSKGLYIGAFAGLVMGLAVFILNFQIYNPLQYPRLAEDIGFLISQLGIHMFFNMVWGMVFGILFVRFYERIPRKGVLKGIIFSMVIFFFTSFQWAILCLAFGSEYALFWFSALTSTGFVGFLSYGIVLGILYKR